MKIDSNPESHSDKTLSETSEPDQGLSSYIESTTATLLDRGQYYGNLSTALMQSGSEFAVRRTRSDILNRFSMRLDAVNDAQDISLYDASILEALTVQLSDTQKDMAAVLPTLRSLDIEVIVEDQGKSLDVMEGEATALANKDESSDKTPLDNAYIALRRLRAIIGMLGDSSFLEDIDIVQRKEDDIDAISTILKNHTVKIRQNEYDETLILKLKGMIDELKQASQKSDTARSAISRDAKTMYGTSSEIIESSIPRDEKDTRKQIAGKIMSRLSLDNTIND